MLHRWVTATAYTHPCLTEARLQPYSHLWLQGYYDYVAPYYVATY